MFPFFSSVVYISYVTNNTYWHVWQETNKNITHQPFLLFIGKERTSMPALRAAQIRSEKVLLSDVYHCWQNNQGEACRWKPVHALSQHPCVFAGQRESSLRFPLNYIQFLSGVHWSQLKAGCFWDICFQRLWCFSVDTGICSKCRNVTTSCFVAPGASGPSVNVSSVGDDEANAEWIREQCSYATHGLR